MDAQVLALQQFIRQSVGSRAAYGPEAEDLLVNFFDNPYGHRVLLNITKRTGLCSAIVSSAFDQLAEAVATPVTACQIVARTDLPLSKYRVLQTILNTKNLHVYGVPAPKLLVPRRDLFLAWDKIAADVNLLTVTRSDSTSICWSIYKAIKYIFPVKLF